MTARDFEIHFKRLYLPLGMYALRFVHDVAISEDLVQDAFMKAWLYLENVGTIDNIQAVMYRSV
ncbi:MAG: RNA polymerase sigma-70 factor, partial [Muribaculaceae bacterium]|nr:RNA polymerase sigma-70 factor [Muribaculaceae bacterium]